MVTAIDPTYFMLAETRGQLFSLARVSQLRIGDENNPTPNQFYIARFDEPKAGKIARVSGRIDAWNWTPSIGWQSKTSIPGGLPVISGFGYRGYIPDLASEIADAVKNRKRLQWLELVGSFPDVGRLIPSDIESLVKTLEAQGLVVTQADGRLLELVVENA